MEKEKPFIEMNYTHDAKPRRGYHSYLRKVVFNKSWTNEEMQKFMNDMFENERSSRQWMWVHPPNMFDEQTWTMKLGYDSGD